MFVAYKRRKEGKEERKKKGQNPAAKGHVKVELRVAPVEGTNHASMFGSQG